MIEVLSVSNNIKVTEFKYGGERFKLVEYVMIEDRDIAFELYKGSGMHVPQEDDWTNTVWTWAMAGGERLTLEELMRVYELHRKLDPATRGS